MTRFPGKSRDRIPDRVAVDRLLDFLVVRLRQQLAKLGRFHGPDFGVTVLLQPDKWPILIVVKKRKLFSQLAKLCLRRTSEGPIFLRTYPWKPYRDPVPNAAGNLSSLSPRN